MRDVDEKKRTRKCGVEAALFPIITFIPFQFCEQPYNFKEHNEKASRFIAMMVKSTSTVTPFSQHLSKPPVVVVGITLRLPANSLYINPRQFTFQLPLLQEMRKEGLPIEGLLSISVIRHTRRQC